MFHSSVSRFLVICALALIVAQPTLAQVEITDQQFATARNFFQYVFNFTLDDQTSASLRDGLNTESASNPMTTQKLLDSMTSILTWQQNQSTFSKTILRMYLEPNLVSSLQVDQSATRPMSLSAPTQSPLALGVAAR